MQKPTIAMPSVLLKRLIYCLLALSCLSAAYVPHAPEPPQLKTASSHPIQYYVSLPEGWTSGKKWPVVVVIESADREFLNATLPSFKRVNIVHSSWSRLSS
jgi:hypothetical protein